MGAAIALVGAFGVWLLWSEFALGHRGLTRMATSPSGERTMDLDVRARRWLRQAGLEDVQPREFAIACLAFGLLGAAIGWVVFAGPIAAACVGLFAATFPIAGYRKRRQARLAAAQEAWPRILEEIRLLTGAMGQSIPQALFEAGSRSPDALRPAFEAAHREWMLTRNFEATTRILRGLLADPTADVTCETLLVAHEIGGADLDARLAALAEDRRIDVLDRKDAASKQAGVRFARRFVLLVPLGMAVAGMSVGDGRHAYGTPTGQMLVALGIALVVACWAWSARIMALPPERRVFK